MNHHRIAIYTVTLIAAAGVIGGCGSGSENGNENGNDFSNMSEEELSQLTLTPENCEQVGIRSAEIAGYTDEVGLYRYRRATCAGIKVLADQP